MVVHRSFFSSLVSTSSESSETLISLSFTGVYVRPLVNGSSEVRKFVIVLIVVALLIVESINLLLVRSLTLLSSDDSTASAPSFPERLPLVSLSSASFEGPIGSVSSSAGGPIG